MKKKLLKPVEGQSERFSTFVRELAQKFNPLNILKFGEISTNKDSCSSFMPEQKNSTFHYYLLMVIEGTTRIEHGVQDYVNTHFNYGKITILVHSKESVEAAIAGNNRFFINVFNTGIQLYSHDGTFNLFPEYQLDKKISLEKAKKHLYHRIPMAQGFLDGAGECYSNEKFNVCVFMLHQVVEQSCIAMIRVFMAYRSDIHHLGRLLDICACFSEKPRELLLGTPDNRRLFEKLMNSYSHARYKDNFNVEMGDADKLYTLVHNFLVLAKSLCDKKIDLLARSVKIQD
ncbi:HEPN domain-containing protein [Pedobacter sp. ISL-68]|uniref:HEPN domain-containing protein n=1 Tax=unclassified Pedobacter TaxID=2628915 RepID=UPI001BE89B4F|nr:MULTISPECIES: HEPN domain-containing protein [unclassified Pedobacter]MBT2561354.1 HEPN domain-containing protein [Pedobacter sp. ISL-64]MBT2590743.1 HEPN domain-containing protein [Pedobacter sp. ISL-68]